jgi:hypothetical protein
MPWVWVAVGLVFWTLTALVVIALCITVRRIDARLGHDREADRAAMDWERMGRAGDEAE